MSIKVMSIFGTRPEAIKMAPLVKEFEKHIDFESIVCVTAQHREMLDQVLEIFNIKPKYDLNVMTKDQTLGMLTSKIIVQLEGILEKERPQIVLVHGDTTTTFAASLASFYKKIDIGHIEAGLRTNNVYFPFPEELNRRLTSIMAKFHFSPTEINKDNLLKEGINEENIFVVGNTVIDSMKYTIKESYEFKNDVLKSLDFSSKVIVVTAHRRENWGDGIENICRAIKKLSIEYSEDVKFVFLTHLNPFVKNMVHKILGGIKNVDLLDPLDIEDTHNLIKRCYFVMTDSGGIQEEAPYLGKFVLVLRNTTERQEMISEGMVELIGVDSENIYNISKDILDGIKKIKYSRSTTYGDGNTSKKILNILKKNYILD